MGMNSHPLTDFAASRKGTGWAGLVDHWIDKTRAAIGTAVYFA